ncbi:MAG TPA: MopE-related protein [Polyangiales bacterium]|nr:MopE-related protein [Polyangiales bacterium]
MGDPVCDGQVNPETREQCDELDHDCDGNPLTCTQSTCTSTDLLGVGDACGMGIGMCKGTQYCDTSVQPPTLRCIAASGTAEICDGLDNDCDGNTDEDLGPQGPCGSGRGECRPGTYECDTNLGKRVCIGAKGPSDEICDALDNDCDGRVDEGIGLGQMCGESEGRCETGKLVCQGGRTVCSGDIGPMHETCDCTDNDCDGKTDEGTGSSAICPGASVCTHCQCALPCAPTQEFIAQCPQGKAPVRENGECFCVAEQCNDQKCAGQIIERDGVVQCAPDSDEVGTCICQDNACVSRCTGVMCNDGLVCDRTDGRCKQSSCLLPQFKCPTGQRCVLLDQQFGCEDDPCANRECEGDQACRDGECVKSCGAVRCEAGKRCVDGDCVEDKCTMSCSLMPEVCDPESGDCVVAEGLCGISGCVTGQVCNAVSGDCNEDPCLRVHCPVGERCVPESGQCEQRCDTGRVYCDGECINPSSNRRFCGASGDCAGDNDGDRCRSGLVCSLGECSDHCANGLVNCNATCIDPQTDSAHCGASNDCRGEDEGQLCGVTEACVKGQCRSQLPLSPEDTAGVVATGGGGCACSVGPGTPSGAPRQRGLIVAALLGLGLLVARRRRALRVLRAPVVIALAVSVLSLLSACDTRAFKLNRKDADAGTVGPRRDSGIDDSGLIVGRDSGKHEDRDGQADGQVGADACLAEELCNGKDDDCDGKTDEDANLEASHIDTQSDPLHCGGCGQACAITHAFNACQEGHCVIDRGRGEQGCDIGFYDLDENPDNGCEYSCSKTSDDDTACDLLDNDCDGKIDEDVKLEEDVNNCGNCGVRCEFLNAAAAASCVSGKCQLDSSQCDDGFRDVDSRPGTGCEYRCPTPIGDETCNSLDDDCDGKIDENIQTSADNRIGKSCGIATGECETGTTICKDGAPVCSGQRDPSPERCDTKDNDCDGTDDNGFDLMTDKANCGSCGHACVFSSSVNDGHAVLVCVQGMCQVAERGCIGNWSDTNGNFEDGCETPCTFTSEEFCDNIDNDCNGVVDDNVTTPDVICAARESGVCASDLTDLRTKGPECIGGELRCNPANTNIVGAETEETLCDSLDNDCDGRVDEMIPAVGKACSIGTGKCMRSGTYVCDIDPPGYRCNAAAPGSATAEECNGEDDDCDGIVDNIASPSPTTNVAGIEVVNLGGDVLMMAYEASRPDATQTSEGSRTSSPCSAAGRLPWANVTWQEANAACCSLNADGNCADDESGWRLCDVATWEDGCAAASGTCTWSYGDAAICAHGPADTTNEQVCMGAEAAADPSTQLECSTGVTQCATYSGNANFAGCYADWGTDKRLYDLSGNVREWTHSVIGGNGGPVVHAIRGGGYNNFESARTCSFDFNAGDETFHFPSTGFRCCYYP